MTNQQYSTKELESLLKQSRISQEDRNNINENHFNNLIQNCLSLRQNFNNFNDENSNSSLSNLNQFDKSKTLNESKVEIATLSTQILVNLCYDNVEIANKINSNINFMKWIEEQIWIYGKLEEYPEENNDLIRNIIALLKNLSCLIVESITFHSNENFIIGLSKIFSFNENAYQYTLELIDNILEQYGIPEAWKNNSVWIKILFDSINEYIPSELLRLICICVYDSFYKEEFINQFGSKLLNYLLKYSPDYQDEDIMDNLSVLILTISQLYLNTISKDPKSQKIVQFNKNLDEENYSKENKIESSSLNHEFFTKVIQILNSCSEFRNSEQDLNDPNCSSLQNELINRLLELISHFMNESSSMNLFLVKDLNLVHCLKKLRKLNHPTEVDCVKFERQIVRIIGFLALDDSLIEPLVNNYKCHEDLVTIILENRDILLIRNSCIALGNLSRNEVICKEFILSSKVHITLIKELNKHVLSVIEVFNKGDSDKIPDIQYVANLGFTLANLSKCKYDPCLLKLLENGALHICLKMLHPKISPTIHHYAVDVIYNIVISYFNQVNKENKIDESVENNNFDIQIENDLKISKIVKRLKRLIYIEVDKLHLKFMILRCLLELNKHKESETYFLKEGLTKDFFIHEISKLRAKASENDIKLPIELLDSQL